MDESTNQYVNYSSPLGNLLLTFSHNLLVAANFTDNLKPTTYENLSAIAQEVKLQLDSYFQGELNSFNLPIQPHGTPFQQEVWNSLQNIPYANTCSYVELAIKVGGATYTRAVGLANGSNPIAIIIPCHRVIGANGSLVGYAGGIQRKRWLLDHEKRHKHGILELFGPDY